MSTWHDAADFIDQLRPGSRSQKVGQNAVFAGVQLIAEFSDDCVPFGGARVRYGIGLQIDDVSDISGHAGLRDCAFRVLHDWRRRAINGKKAGTAVFSTLSVSRAYRVLALCSIFGQTRAIEVSCLSASFGPETFL